VVEVVLVVLQKVVEDQVEVVLVTLMDQMVQVQEHLDLKILEGVVVEHIVILIVMPQLVEVVVKELL
jgi:hypothetical protein